jgi:hypothetical protein
MTPNTNTIISGAVRTPQQFYHRHRHTTRANMDHVRNVCARILYLCR